MSSGKPNLFQFLDYREFLDTYVDWLKDTRKLSTRQIVKHLGFQNPNYLNLIKAKQRSIPSRRSHEIAHRLGLKGSEIEFFQTLVKFNDCKNPEQKNRLFHDLLKFKSFRNIHPQAEQEFEYFRSWVNVAVFEALNTEWVQLSVEDQADVLGVSKSEIRDALVLLTKLGWIVRDRNGKYRKIEKRIETTAGLSTLYIRLYHLEMMKRGLKAI